MFYEIIFFNTDLKRLASFDRALMFDGKWLYILLPENSTPFWTDVRFVEGKCRFRLKRVFRLW